MQCYAQGGIKVTSSAFKDGAELPAKYRGDNENIAPPLEWSGVPNGAKSITIICEDPDAPAGTFVHWVLFNIPPEVTNIEEGMSPTIMVNNEVKHGLNDFAKIGYYGPTPPSGTHRYFFRVYALDTALSLDTGAGKKKVLNAMEGHILARGEIMATSKSIENEAPEDEYIF